MIPISRHDNQLKKVAVEGLGIEEIAPSLSSPTEAERWDPGPGRHLAGFASLDGLAKVTRSPIGKAACHDGPELP